MKGLFPCIQTHRYFSKGRKGLLRIFISFYSFSFVLILPFTQTNRYTSKGL